MDTRSVIARFEAERQALALVDHPNIAKVLDAGTTETGRPFFVMELVRGIKITEYCDQNNLGTTQRLELFIQVCHAIQHAHQKGVIHRDIKPSNILVTLHDGVPVPKVIDFERSRAYCRQADHGWLLRHGAGLQRLDVADLEIAAPAADEQLLAVHEALDRFAAQQPHKAELVKLRFFAGLSLEDAAEILRVSEATAKRWWVYARAWLYCEIKQRS